MRLHNNLFLNVCQASGSTGFWGEGYPIDRLLGLIPGYTWRGSELVTKTVTVEPRTGNMPLKNDGATPRELLPECVYLDWSKKVMLNAVSLSNRGLQFYLDTGGWQKLKKPFRISFMPVKDTHEERLQECKTFVALFKSYERKRPFRVAIALQLNVSCPNTHQQGGWTVAEIIEYMKVLFGLNMPIEVKFGATYPPDDAVAISRSLYCSAVNGINTVPFGAFPEMIPWEKFFGRKGMPLESPLMRRPRIAMPGGLSGPHIKPVALRWIRAVQDRGCQKPIVGGGGIRCPGDIDQFAAAGASAVSLGSTLKFFGPWNMKRTIRYATEVFAEEPTLDRKVAFERAMI